MPSDPATSSPCQACGACCASFRVSFYWAEAQANGIPPELTEQVTPTFSCMAGTNSRTPRCQALQGTIGQHLTCRIYAQRPSPCREVQPGDEQCAKARALHAMQPLPGSHKGGPNP